MKLVKSIEEAQTEQDVKQAEKEIQSILDKYNLMLCFKEVKINGVVVRTEFGVEKIKIVNP